MKHQASLFDPDDEDKPRDGEAPKTRPPRARKTDPWTSHEAAGKARKFAGKHDVKILAALRATTEALSCEQIADRAESITYIQVVRRMAILCDARAVHVVLGVAVNRNGRRARVFRPGKGGCPNHPRRPSAGPDSKLCRECLGLDEEDEE